MAYAALFSLSQVLELIIPNVQSYFLLCPRKHMKSLHEKVVFLQEFLQDFSLKARQSSANSLEGRITDVSSRVEVIIKSHTSTHQSFDTGQIDEFGGFIKEFNCIVEEAVEIKKSWDHEDLLPSSNVDSSARHAADGKEVIVGINEDLVRIKDRVVGEEPNLQIIPITGMGGIGKTTLARLVYEDRLISDYFDVRHWVTVSQDYNVQDVLLEILSVKGQSDEHVELLIEYVYKSLKGRRYLIVMDDMWHAEVWDRVRRAFLDECNGSRVIITTRLSEVALDIDSNSPLHRMNLLNEDRSWELLREIVYAKKRIHHHMEEIGIKIARSCKGLPLAIVVIGGLLKINKTKEYWESIAKNVAAASTADDDQVSRIFSLSYNHLPNHLKECFLYMGVFPEDHKISVKELYKLWIAHDFLNPQGPKILEELAAEYLEDLVERSLVLVSGRKSNGRIRLCTIHDVLRDLSLRKGNEVNFQEMVKIQQHTMRYSANINFLEANLQNTPADRSQFENLSKKQKLTTFVSRFKSLRVVDALKLQTNQFPDQIFELVNLRYLAFTYNFSGKCRISSSISKLQNLQTLIVDSNGIRADYQRELLMPSEIWKMPQLRHLVLMRNTTFISPQGDVLENLQTFSNAMNFKFTPHAIGCFPNLKKLRIQYHSNDPVKWEKFCLHNLVLLHQVEEMNFRFHAGPRLVNRHPLHTNLAFPQKLKKLALTRSAILWEKMSMIGCLPNLQILKLMKDSFVGRNWDPIEGEFLVLKYLEIENTNLVEWNVESGHFPSLEKLLIRWCYELKDVPSSVGEIPTLQSIFMQNCNYEAEESVRKIKEEQEDFGNDVLKVEIAYPSDPPVVKPQKAYEKSKPRRDRVVYSDDLLQHNLFEPEEESVRQITVQTKQEQSTPNLTRNKKQNRNRNRNRHRHRHQNEQSLEDAGTTMGIRRLGRGG